LNFNPKKTGSGPKSKVFAGVLALRASRQIEATRSEPRLFECPFCMGEERRVWRASEMPDGQVSVCHDGKGRGQV